MWWHWQPLHRCILHIVIGRPFQRFSTGMKLCNGRPASFIFWSRISECGHSHTQDLSSSDSRTSCDLFYGGKTWLISDWSRSKHDAQGRNNTARQSQGSGLRLWPNYPKSYFFLWCLILLAPSGALFVATGTGNQLFEFAHNWKPQCHNSRSKVQNPRCYYHYWHLWLLCYPNTFYVQWRKYFESLCPYRGSIEGL